MEKESSRSNQDSSQQAKNQRGRAFSPKPIIGSDFELGRIPPQALDVEESVLGSLLLERNALNAVIDILRSEVFYKESHQRIYEAISELFARSEPIDLVTVTSELRMRGMLEMVGGAYYLSLLTHKVASAANIEFYAKILIEKHVKRQLISDCTEIIRDSYENSTDAFDLLDKAEAKLFDISEQNFRNEFESIEKLISKTLEEMDTIQQNEGGLRGVPSGFTELDRITGGWQKSDLIILAARPSMGKTAFALSMALNMAVRFARPVAFFSLEMDGSQLAMRLMSSQSGIPLSKLRRGEMSDYERKLLHERLAALEKAKIFIDDTPALSIFELRAKCRRMKEQHKIEAVMIDYLQLMSGSSDGKGNREQEISMISRSLKIMAKELSIPIIVLSQLNRAVELRANSKKPILADLRESGAIEQDADMVLFVYRPEYYKIDQDDKGNTEGMADIIISKHRNGGLGEVRLRFNGECAQFLDNNPVGFLEMQGNNNFETGEPSGYIVTMGSKVNEDHTPDFLPPADDGDLEF